MVAGWEVEVMAEAEVNLRALNAAVPNFVSPFLQTLSIMGSYNTMDSACSVNNVYDLTIPCIGARPNRRSGGQVRVGRQHSGGSALHGGDAGGDARSVRIHLQI